MFLQDLFGPPDVSQAPPPPNQLPPEVEAFLMNRAQQAQPVEQAPPMRAEAPPQTQQAPVEEEIVASGRPPYERKGMFGIKGTARDILGLIGDAFLVQGGADPLYRKVRDQEKQADAMRGFGEDPYGSIEALNKAGFADVSRELYKDYAGIESKRQAHQLAVGKDKRDAINDAFLNKSRLANTEKDVVANIRSSLTGLSNIKDPAARELAYQRRKQLIAEYINEYGTEEMAAIVKDALPDMYEEGIETRFIDPQAQARLADTDLAREQQARLAREAEAARERRFNESERGRNARFQKAEEGKRERAKKSGPSFKIPDPPAQFKRK